MFSIDNFEVYIDNTDISAMITSMSLYESIHGNLKGTIHIEDKLNQRGKDIDMFGTVDKFLKDREEYSAN